MERKERENKSELGEKAQGKWEYIYIERVNDNCSKDRNEEKIRKKYKERN